MIFFIEHKYWLNRRILNKYLNQKDLNFTKRTLEYFPDIVEYKFKTFKVLIYTKELKLSLHLLDIYTDTIGLFTSSSSEDYYVSNLIRKLNNL